MIRVGVIGLGKVGRIRAQELSQINSVSVSGYFDPAMNHDPDFGLSRFPSSHDLIQSEEIDAVVISTPNDQTASLVAQSLTTGKHVFAEKPPARNLLEFSKITQARERMQDKTLMFGFNHRHKSSVRKIVELIDSGELGELNWIRCRYGKEPESGNHSENNWRKIPEVAGGGIFLDQGVHGLDLILKFMGNPTEVHAMFSKGPLETIGMETNAFVQLRNSETSLSASLHSTSLQWRYMFSLELSLTRGSVVLNGLKTPSGSYGDETLTVHEVTESGTRKTEEFPSIHDDSWAVETQEFIDCIQTGRQPRDGSYEDAKLLTEVVDRAYSSDTSWNRPKIS